MKIIVELHCQNKLDGDSKIKTMESDGWKLRAKPKKVYVLDGDGYSTPVRGKFFTMEKDINNG